MKVNRASKRTSSSTFRVSSNSGVVSPGKPTITSEVSTISGMRARRARILSRCCSMVCFRFITFRTRSFPAWKGRWSTGATFSHRAMVSKSFWVASLGWEVINRMRKSPGTAFTRSSRSAKSMGSSRSLP